MCVAPNTRISADMQCASTYGYYPCGDWKNVVSTNATDDFTVEISVSTGMLRMGNVHIGFTTRAAFLANAFMLQSPGVYTLWPLCGVLYGKGYCGKYDGRPVRRGGIDWRIRCVFDRDHGTISFHVNGVDMGIAWDYVDAESTLYAVAVICESDVDIHLV